jgi:hypothetical protein
MPSSRTRLGATPAPPIEANPSSKSHRGVVEEDLAAARADQDAEVLQKAQELLEIIQRQAPETAQAIGVDLKDIEGASLAIRRVIASGPGVRVEHAKLSGDITIEDVHAGRQGGRRPNAQRHPVSRRLPHSSSTTSSWVAISRSAR